MDSENNLCHDFIWNIENFSMCFFSGKGKLKSGTFMTGKLDKTQWRCWLYPKADDGTVLFSVARISESDEGPEKFPLRFKVFLIKADGSEMFIKKQKIEIKQDTHSKQTLLISREKLFGDKPNYLPKDILTVKFRLCRDRDRTDCTQTTLHTSMNMERFAFEWSVENFSETNETKTMTFGTEPDIYKVFFRYVASEKDDESGQKATKISPANGSEQKASEIDSADGLEQKVSKIDTADGLEQKATKKVTTDKLVQKIVDDEARDMIELTLRQQKAREKPVFVISRITTLFDKDPPPNAVWIMDPGEGIHTEFIFPEKSTDSATLFHLILDEISRNRLRLQTGDVMKLGLNFIIADGAHTSEVMGSSPAVRIDEERTLQVDVKNMRRSSVCADVKLRANDGEETLCHKWVLASRSRVFRNRFEKMTLVKLLGVEDEKTSITIQQKGDDSKCEEGQQIRDILDFPDLDAVTLTQIVNFMYSDQLCPEATSDFKSCSRMFCAADCYELPLLKAECLRSLVDKMDARSVFDALTLAADSNDGRLRLAALDYFNEHREVVLLSDEWQDFCSAEPVLADNVLCHLRVVRQQDSYTQVIS